MILIAGPCVFEDYQSLKEITENILNIIKDKDINFYLKASAIKDNRTSVNNFYGHGFQRCWLTMNNVKKEYDVKITTDFHSTRQIAEWGKEVDLIQIPAYLAQQTSLLATAVETGKPIHIKKPQFLGPIEIKQPVQKLLDYGMEEEIFISDRGTQLGYNQTFMDPRHFTIMKTYGQYILADVTHPNKNYPGDKYENSLSLAKSAIVSGADGIFLETHPNCSEALCDGETMIPLDKLKTFIDEVYDLWEYENDKH